MDFLRNAGPTIWVQETLGPGYDGLFHMLGILGTSWGLLLAGALGFWWFGRRVLYGLLTVAAAEALARTLLASAFDIARPDHPSIVKYEQVTNSPSFPSGHVATATAIWVFMARATRFPVGLSIAIVFMVAVGRMYLGVHYLSDVVAGVLLGTAIAMAGPKLVEYLAAQVKGVRFRVWAGLAALALVLAVVAMVVLSPDNPHVWRAAGFGAALAIALPLEWRFVRYEPALKRGLRLRSALVGFLGLAPAVLMQLLLDQQSNAFGAGLIFLATLWVLLLAPSLFVRWNWSAEGSFERAAAVRHAARVAGVVLAAVLGLLAYGSLIEPRLLLDVREETRSLPGLPQSWAGGRVAIIADLQVGMWGDNTRMVRRVAETIVRDSPDVVLIAGDFIYKPGKDAADEAREVMELLAPLARSGIPVFAVLGNHDWAVEKAGAPVDEEAGRTIERALEDAGIAVLRNEARQVRRRGSPNSRTEERGRVTSVSSDAAVLWVVGIGSKWAGKDEPAEAVAAVPPGAARVVFMHNPDSYEALPAGQAPLAVAGHTHGGQFRIPFLPDWSWMTFAVEDEVHADGWVSPDYGAPGNNLYVNRGIGFSLVPMRINARPELTYITLEPGGISDQAEPQR